MINFLLGMIVMYFIINLYFATIGINNSPTQFKDVKKMAWCGFWVDMLIGIWIRGIMYKAEVLTNWNLVMMSILKGDNGAEKK